MLRKYLGKIYVEEIHKLITLRHLIKGVVGRRLLRDVYSEVLSLLN